MLRVLNHPTYARLFTAQIVALVGTGLMTVALGLLAYDLAGADAGAVLGTALGIKMVSYVVLSPLAAALVAKLPRRTVMIVADLIRAAVALTLPFIDAVWQIYVLIFILQSASATFTPTFQAVIPDILPDEDDYTRALSLARLAYDLENLASPALAAILLTVISFHGLFVGTVLGFLISALLVQLTTIPKVTAPTRPFRERLTRGLAIYLSTPRLRGLLALNLVVAATAAFILVNTVPLVKSVYSGNDTDTAIALAAFGAGSMVAALALPYLLSHWSDRPIMLCAAIIATALTILHGALSVSLILPWLFFLATWFAIGVTFSAALTPSARLLRKSSDSSDRPALFAAQFALSHACWLLTYILAGWLSIWIGFGFTQVFLGMLALFGVLIALRVWPKLDPDIPHAHPNLPRNHPHLQEHPSPHKHPAMADGLH